MELAKVDGWDESSLEDLLDFYIGGDWGKDPEYQDDTMELAYCIRGSEIKNWNDAKGKTASLRKIKKANVIKRKLLVGDILVEISGGGPDQPVGRTVLIDQAALSFEPSIPKICTNFLRLIRPKKSISSKYLNLYFRLFYSSGDIVALQNGSNNLRNLKFPEFLAISIPYPSIEAQNQIVEKIEELFSELDKGVENLKTAQQQLKIYRQAVLKWAFEGKLTNEGVKDGELPEGWATTTIGNHVDCVVPNRDKPKTFSGNIPWLTTPSLHGELINVDYTKIKLGLTEDEAKLFKAKIIPVNSVVMTCVGTFGIAVVLSKEAIINQQLHAFLPSETFLPKYLAYNIKNQKDYCEKTATTTTIAYLNKTNCNSIPIPVCSIEEQQNVIQEIESRLSVCDKIEETITTSLQQAEALRQSILKKAFEGKLVKPKLKEVYKPKNVYFYQVQVLAAIAEASKKKGINHGEMTIAKYAYLVDTIYKIPTYYTYNRWHLGPYPPEMKKAVTNNKFFSRVNNSIEVRDIEAITKYSNPYTDKLNAAIDDLSNMFINYEGKSRSHEIELLATVCKVIEDIQSTDLKLVRLSMAEWVIDLSNTSYKNKAEKFSENDTIRCLQRIIRNGWLNKLIVAVR